jgi:selenocysteine-specific elongation factor
VHAPIRRRDLAARTLLSADELDEGLAALEQTGEWLFAADWLAELRAAVRSRLEERASSSPIDPGVAVGELVPAEPWRSAILPLLEVDLRGGKAYLPGTGASLAGREEAAERLEAALAAARLSPVAVDDPDLAAYLEGEGRLDGLAIGADAYEGARAALIEECERSGRVTLARFRDLLGVSRRPAQLLLERFDADGLTRRVGDERVLRRAARSTTR